MEKYYVITNGSNAGIYTDSNHFMQLCKGGNVGKSKSCKSIEAAAEHLELNAQLPKAFYTIRTGKYAGIYLNRKNFEKYKPPGTIDFAAPSLDVALAEFSKKDQANTAYIDGSVDSVTHTCKYGGFFIYEGFRYDFSGVFTPPTHELGNSNMAELAASCAAVSLAVSLGAEEINIFYDFDGIMKWAKTRAEKCKTKQEYYDFMNSAPIEISFTHVKGHSGDADNTIANRLARNAMATLPNPLTGTGNMLVRCTRLEELAPLNLRLSALEEEIRELKKTNEKLLEAVMSLKTTTK